MSPVNAVHHAIDKQAVFCHTPIVIHTHLLTLTSIPHHHQCRPSCDRQAVWDNSGIEAVQEVQAGGNREAPGTDEASGVDEAQGVLTAEPQLKALLKRGIMKDEHECMTLSY